MILRTDTDMSAARPPEGARAPSGGSAARETANVGAIPWMQYICHACGYIYDEETGDPDGGLAAGTRFEDIPDDWACPLCGVTKADFEPYTAPSLEALKTRTGSLGAPQTQGRRGQSAGVVIVGAGRAGWQLAENLRALDAQLPITLVTGCAGDLYDKPPAVHCDGPATHARKAGEGKRRAGRAALECAPDGLHPRHPDLPRYPHAAHHAWHVAL